MDMESDILSLSTGALLGLVVILFLALSYVLKKRSSDARPPLYEGWIPWLGCAVEFGVNPLDFIEEKRKQLGSVYTLYVAGERLTFLTDPDHFSHFFQSNCVDFQKAVQDPVQNVASVSEKSFFLYHTKIHDMVKGRLASSRLDYFTPKLQQEFEKQFLRSIGDHGSGDLVNIVRNSMYAAVMDNLFGENVLPTESQKEFMVTAKHFITFDDQFEYGARLPSLFLREWSTAKSHLLGIFRKVVKSLNQGNTDSQTETLLETLVGLVDKQHAPNYGLLLLWASLANAIPITFWTLAYIHSNTGVLSKLRSDIDAAVRQVQKDGKICYDDELFRKVPYLKWCILEAIRLRSPGIITRRVVKSFQVKGMTIPEGDMLMLSPFWAHRNPKYFENPNSFNPDRWMNAELEKNIFLDGFVAFGGGRYQCPGRWYALMEIQMYVAMFIWKYDCSMINDKVPSHSRKHLVGTQQPSEPCPVQYSLRKH